MSLDDLEVGSNGLRVAADRPDCLVLQVDRPVKAERLQAMRDQLDAFTQKHGVPVLILDAGVSVATSDAGRLKRLEAKLDALIEALAEDEDQGPTHDMDGNRLPGADTGAEFL